MSSSKHILITGGSGMIGTFLAEKLDKKGYKVSILSRVRHKSKWPVYNWDPSNKYVQPGALEDVTHIVHLAGAGIADKRWTKNRMKLLTESRILTAGLLFDTLKKRGQKIEAFISAGGIGYYGDRGDEWLDESEPPSVEFLAELAIGWEQAAQKFREIADRVVINRTGLVLSSDGGILRRLSVPIKLGIVPIFGSGKQYYSWIHIEDLGRWFVETVENGRVKGIFNVVSPNAVRHRELMIQIRKIVNKFSILFPIPAFALRIGLGKLATTVLISQKVRPERMVEAGFQYRYETLEAALKNLLCTPK